MDQDCAIARDAELPHVRLADALAGRRFYGITPDFFDEHGSCQLLLVNQIPSVGSSVKLYVRTKFFCRRNPSDSYSRSAPALPGLTSRASATASNGLVWSRNLKKRRPIPRLRASGITNISSTNRRVPPNSLLQ